MRKLLIILILLATNISCKTKFSTTALENNFSKEQIQDLNKITLFFKNQICDNQNEDFKTCFSELLPELLNNGWIPILEKVDFEKQKIMYKSISSKTFQEIWSLQKGTRLDSGYTYKSLKSKYKGKYQKYLQELGRNNKAIKDYSNRVISMGDFGSILPQEIYKNPKAFDLDNSNIQLLIAIHFLTQNDQQKRNEAWE